MGWQELLILAVMAVPFYLLWKIINVRDASYWWLLLMLFGWVLGPLLGFLFIPKPKAAAPSVLP